MKSINPKEFIIDIKGLQMLGIRDIILITEEKMFRIRHRINIAKFIKDLYEHKRRTNRTTKSKGED